MICGWRFLNGVRMECAARRLTADDGHPGESHQPFSGSAAPGRNRADTSIRWIASRTASPLGRLTCAQWRSSIGVDMTLTTLDPSRCANRRAFLSSVATAKLRLSASAIVIASPSSRLIEYATYSSCSSSSLSSTRRSTPESRSSSTRTSSGGSPARSERTYRVSSRTAGQI